MTGWRRVVEGPASPCSDSHRRAHTVFSLPPDVPPPVRCPWPNVQMLLSTDELASTPFLILGNKIDIPGAASEGEIRHAMGLLETVGKEGRVDTGIRPTEVFMCSIVRRTGYGDGACLWSVAGSPARVSGVVAPGLARP